MAKRTSYTLFDTEKAIEARNYVVLPRRFILMLNEFKNNRSVVKDKQLKKDLEFVIQFIRRTHRRQELEKDNRSKKGFLVSDIQKINRIMRRVPLRIGVDFVLFEEKKKQAGHRNVKEAFENYKDYLVKIIKLNRGHKSTRVKLYPYVPEHIHYHESLGRDDCRHLLSVGLFEFFQRLLIRKNGPILLIGICKMCDDFYFAFGRKEYCCGECRWGHWSKTHSEDNRKKTRDFRERQKKTQARGPVTTA